MTKFYYHVIIFKNKHKNNIFLKFIHFFCKLDYLHTYKIVNSISSSLFKNILLLIVKMNILEYSIFYCKALGKRKGSGIQS